jgi:hypothetical protein
MQERIDAREAELTADMKPKGALQRVLVTEIARASVQVRVCQEQLNIDHQRVKETGDSEWDADRGREVNNLAARLAKDPRRVVHALEETLHGAEWCLEQWRGLGASAAQNGGLTEPQRQLCCDLMGIAPLLRDNFAKVPACDDKQGLLALVAREVKRLETKVILVLRGRDNVLRAKARLGLPMPPDATTKRIKSNESRATKRLMWSIQTFNDVQRGIAPATIIDPVTKQPLRPEPQAPPSSSPSPPPQTGTAAAPAPTAPEAQADHPPENPAADDPMPLPDGATDEDREMLTLVGATLRSMLQAGVLKPSPLPGRTPDVSPPAQT